MQSLEYHTAIDRKAPKKNVQSDHLNLSAKNFAHTEHLHAFIELSNQNYLLCLQFALLSMHKTFSPLCISICLLQHHPTLAFVITHTHNFTCLSNNMWLVWEFQTTFDWPIFWQYHQFINLKCANNKWCSSKLKVIVGLGLSWLRKGVVADQSLDHWA